VGCCGPWAGGFCKVNKQPTGDFASKAVLLEDPQRIKKQKKVKRRVNSKKIVVYDKFTQNFS
jgi:hypothetical protein